MRSIALSFLVTSLLVFLVQPLSLGPFDEAGLFDSDSYSDTPIEPAPALTEVDLNTEPVGEPNLLASSGNSGDSYDLFGSQDQSGFLNLPDDGSTNADALLALGPISDSSDQMQAGLPPSHADSNTNEKPQDWGDTLNKYVDEGLNDLLRFAAPLSSECDMKTGGRVALCCTSPRKQLPRAYGCRPFNLFDLDCQFFNYQFCCLGYNPIDQEGVGCTQGFYVE